VSVLIVPNRLTQVKNSIALSASNVIVAYASNTNNVSNYNASKPMAVLSVPVAERLSFPFSLWITSITTAIMNEESFAVPILEEEVILTTSI